MAPEDVEIGAEYVVRPDPERNGQEHPIFYGGNLVTVKGGPDSDGEFFVNAEAVDDDATVAGWISAEYLMTKDEADELLAQIVTDSEEWTESFSLPAYEDVPLGYALGLMAYIQGAQAATAVTVRNIVNG